MGHSFTFLYTYCIVSITRDLKVYLIERKKSIGQKKAEDFYFTRNEYYYIQHSKEKEKISAEC